MSDHGHARRAPDTVGARSAPLGTGDTHTIAVRGTNGNCTIPSDAVGVVMNVAAVNPSAASFLVVYPADAVRPLAANLNWLANDPPISNSVTSDLSADGRVSFYNLAGVVDVTADIVGYYADHHHDDRYFTKAETYTRAEVDALPAKLPVLRTITVGAATTIAPYECVFIFIYGVFGDAQANNVIAFHIVDVSDQRIPSINNLNSFEPGVAFKTSQGGTVAYGRMCNLDSSPNALPAGWKIVTRVI